MANAGCINAYNCDGCLIQTLGTLDSANIGVGVQFCAPDPLDDKRLDYIKYTDKCGNTCCLTGENEILIYATQGTIKNVVLTNDDTNEVVNVKRTDLFGSNRKKTVVRYKTGGFPTSITDGTLAVEELVQNQYQSSGYNVSGLTDGTTYYFTAFAVAQDDTIIVVQSSSITTDFGRKPDSTRTMLYLPLENDFVERSGNTRTITTSGISYTTVGGIPSLHLGSSGGGILTSPYPLQSDPTKPITISVLIYVSSAQISSRRNIIEFACTNGNRIFFCLKENTSNIEYTSSQGDTVYATLHAPIIANSRMHIVAVGTTTSTKLYVNGELKESGNGNPKPRGNRPYGRDNKQGIFNRRDGDYAMSLQGNARELIMEQVERDATFINNYYNSIKNKLGF